MGQLPLPMLADRRAGNAFRIRRYSLSTGPL